MRRGLKIIFPGLMALILIGGCATTQELKSTITSKVSSITSTVDPALVNQVPADKRGGFARAAFDLNAAEQKLKLAELKKQLSANQEKYALYEEDLAGKELKEAEIVYDLVKMDAIINSGLGKKEETAKTKASLQSKKLGVEADKVEIKAKIEATKDKIEGLKAEVAKMEEAVKAMKFEEGKIAESQKKSPESQKADGK